MLLEFLVVFAEAEEIWKDVEEVAQRARVFGRRSTTRSTEVTRIRERGYTPQRQRATQTEPVKTPVAMMRSISSLLSVWLWYGGVSLTALPASFGNLRHPHCVALDFE